MKENLLFLVMMKTLKGNLQPRRWAPVDRRFWINLHLPDEPSYRRLFSRGESPYTMVTLKRLVIVIRPSHLPGEEDLGGGDVTGAWFEVEVTDQPLVPQFYPDSVRVSGWMVGERFTVPGKDGVPLFINLRGDAARNREWYANQEKENVYIYEPEEITRRLRLDWMKMDRETETPPDKESWWRSTDVVRQIYFSNLYLPERFNLSGMDWEYVRV